MPRGPRTQSPETWAQQLNFAGLEQRHGLPRGLLTNLIRQESAGDPDAGSHAGAQGLFQFMPGTARQYGVNVRDPQSSANGGARLLEDLLDMFNGDVEKALAGYNAGPGRVRGAMRRAQQNGGDWRNYLPQETQNYIRIVGQGITPGSAQRVASGNATPDDQTEEAERRRRRLAEANIDPSVVQSLEANELLGKLFFALIRGFLENRMVGAYGNTPGINDIRTTREERVAEMGEDTVGRAEQLQVQSEVAKMQSGASQPAPQQPTADRGDLGGLPSQDSLPRLASRTPQQPVPAL